MKKSTILFAFFFLSILSSCLDTEEKIIVNADNSGMYSVTMDLGRMLQMTKSMGLDKSVSGIENSSKDTTLYLRDLIKDSDNLSAKEKSLYSDGAIHLVLNEAENAMKVIMSTPFKSAADLTEVKNNFSNVMGKLEAFEKAVGQKMLPGEGDENAVEQGKSSANPVADQFIFKAEKGRISNSIANMEAYKKLVATDSTLGMMTQMTSMMGDFNYRTTIVLPKAAKKIEGPGTTISKDKKTIGFFTTLTEMLEHPEKVSYKIEY